jgi:hypothetical protein
MSITASGAAILWFQFRQYYGYNDSKVISLCMAADSSFATFTPKSKTLVVETFTQLGVWRICPAGNWEAIAAVEELESLGASAIWLKLNEKS